MNEEIQNVNINPFLHSDKSYLWIFASYARSTESRALDRSMYSRNCYYMFDYVSTDRNLCCLVFELNLRASKADQGYKIVSLPSLQFWCSGKALVLKNVGISHVAYQNSF